MSAFIPTDKVPNFQAFSTASPQTPNLPPFPSSRIPSNRPCHSLLKTVSPDAVASPEAALHQLQEIDFCGKQNLGHRHKVGRRSLDIYLDYDALITWLDRQKDVDPRVDRIRRVPKPDEADNELSLARRSATKEARRVRDFIFIATGLLFIHKTVSVGHKLKWTCQSRCSQSDRLKGGRSSRGTNGDLRRSPTSRARYPCQGTTTVSLLHRQPGQRQLLHLVIKHDYIHAPHDERSRERQSTDMAESDLRVIDPALQNCSFPSPEISGTASANIPATSSLFPASSSASEPLGAVTVAKGSHRVDPESEHYGKVREKVQSLMEEDQRRTQTISQIVMDQLSLGTRLEFFENLFNKRREIMKDLEPLVNMKRQQVDPHLFPSEKLPPSFESFPI